MSEDEEASGDLAEVLAQFMNVIMNERVRSYNEGVDAERNRCIKAVATVMNIDPDTAGGSIFDALRAVVSRKS